MRAEHPRKLVVVADDSPECAVALRFAAGRAKLIQGGELILFTAIAPLDFVGFGAVTATLEAEEMEKAEAMLAARAADVAAYNGLVAKPVIRKGQKDEALVAYLKAETDLFGLLLGASATGEPGPLVDYFSGPVAGSLPCPVIIVPGGLSLAQIDQLI
jgi:nucleotide-binding universal stress UspA family protein